VRYARQKTREDLQVATFDELAKQYAARLKKSIASDGFIAHGEVSPEELKTSETLREAKSIKGEIDGLSYTSSGKPLSDADKQIIVERIDEELGRSFEIRKSVPVFESASNDDLSKLADVIESILRGKNK
jgi:hypothetical protein